jgi:hypothetical protein
MGNASGTNTILGANVFSLAPGASTSAISTTGALYAAGTGTTNFPHFLIQPTAATASALWSTAGTAIGVNLASTSPDFIRCFVNGTGSGGVTGGYFRVSGAGNMTSSGAQYVQASSDFSTFKYAVGTSAAAVLSGWQITWAASSTQAEGTKDLSIGRNAAGILQIGNGTANASGSLTCTNVTASGTLAVTGASTFTGKATMNGGRQSAYVAKTALYTIASATDYCINCTSGTYSITLPTAVSIAGQEFIVKNSGTGVITIATTSSQTIDGQASGSITLNQYDSLSVMSDGANWIIT